MILGITFYYFTREWLGKDRRTETGIVTIDIPITSIIESSIPIFGVAHNEQFTC